MRSSSHAGAALRIDLDAIAANYRLLRERAGPARCVAVVKADAYGLGIDRVAPALAAAGCGTFFVATLDEGIELRFLLSDAEIYVLNGLPPGSADVFQTHGLSPVLNQLSEIDSWRAFLRSKNRSPDGVGRRAALHLDTGMNRLGMPPADVAVLAEKPRLLEGIELDWIISHLACAEQPDHPLNREQLDRFNRLRGVLPPTPAGLAASSGIFLGPDFHLNLVRPGAALYGINPTPNEPNPMAEVVRLQGKILQVRDVDSPDTVGYGAAHRVREKGQIATVAVGYADGFLRAFSQRGWGAIDGVRVPLVGRVSMDLITFDISAVAPEKAVPGTPIDLIGGALDIDEVAGHADTIGYEVLVQLGRRYHRIYRGGSGAA